MKKTISLALAIVLTVLLLPAGFIVISAETPSGTAIGSAAELLALMGDSGKWAGDYYLSSDIDLTGLSGQKPIGTTATAFTGAFDGNGKTVSGINISGAKYQGFFGYVDGATVKNLTVSGTVTETTAVDTMVYTGGFVGVAAGSCTFENIVSYVDVNADAHAGVNAVGGMFGWVACTSTDPLNPSTVVINNCHFYGTVKSGRSLGGFIGVLSVSGAATAIATLGARVSITSCSSNGSVIYRSSTGFAQAGGFIGFIYYRNADGFEITLDSCVNNADCTNGPSIAGKSRAAGFIGWVNGEGFTAPATDAAAGGTTTLINCVNNGNISGSANIGGFFGQITVYRRTNVYIITENCVNNGLLSASGAASGGIAAYIIGGECVFRGCANYGDISSSGSSVGGILGGTLKAANSALVKAVISDCASYANLTGSTDVGGIVGKSPASDFIEIRRCFSGGNTTGTASGAIAANVINLTPENNYYTNGTADANGTPLSAAEAASSASYTGWDFGDVWFATSAGPRLKAFSQTKLVGTAIRTSGAQGLRFKAEIPYAALEAQAEREGYTVKEYGVLIKPATNENDLAYFETVNYDSNYNRDRIGKGVAYCVSDSKDYRFSDNGIKVQFTSVLIDIDEANYETDFTYRSYIVLNDGTNDIVLYSAEATASIYYVAARIVEQEYGGVVANAPEYVRTIVNAHVG